MCLLAWTQDTQKFRKNYALATLCARIQVILCTMPHRMGHLQIGHMHSTGRALELAAEGRRATWRVERPLCGKRACNIAPGSKVHHAAPLAGARAPQCPVIISSGPRTQVDVDVAVP